MKPISVTTDDGYQWNIAPGLLRLVQPENFPETVKAVRRQLSHALGVSFATVNRWENHKTVPSKLAQRQFEQFCEQKKKQGELF